MVPVPPPGTGRSDCRTPAHVPGAARYVPGGPVTASLSFRIHPFTWATPPPPSPPPLPPPPVCSLTMTLFSFCSFVYSVLPIRSAHPCNRVLFVFVCLTYFTDVTPSGSIHVVRKGEVSFTFTAEQCFLVCMSHSFVIPSSLTGPWVVPDLGYG